MGIFEPRHAFKPFEYPDLSDFKDAINHSYWLVTEWNFDSDIQHFHVSLSDPERAAITKTLLAISQIEVAVKRFWSNIGNRFPKPEIEQVGITFGESEVRHADAYSHLLHILGLDDQFAVIINEPVIAGRMEYLAKYMQPLVADQDYAFVLALFSLFIENVSLFSQFLIIKSFSSNQNKLKAIDNVVQATQKEETVHGLFGVRLIEYIRADYPEWFDDGFYTLLTEVAEKAFDAESNIIDWIFAAGELPFLPVPVIKEFIKSRINEGVIQIGGRPVFVIDETLLSHVTWFTNELHAEVNTDFFYKRPVTYSKKMQSITAGDLF